MGGGGGSTQNFNASIPLANIARAQWADYQKRFMPYETRLINAGTSEANYLPAEKMAEQNTNNGFGLAQAASDRDLSRYGATMTPAQQDANNLNMSIQKAQSGVANVNEARGNIWDNENGVMTGGLSQAGRTLRT
jgi:hypothetical protein